MKLSRNVYFLLLSFLITAVVVTLPAMLAGKAASGGTALAADDSDDWEDDEWEDEGDEEDAFGNIMHTTYIKINDVKFTAPAANAPCKVTASLEIVGAEDEEDEVTVAAAKIWYSVNGDLKGKKSVDMTCDGTTCAGDIPGQAGGAKVTFAISAADNFGNTTTQGFKVVSADAAEDALVPGTPDMDNTEDIVPANMDLMDTAAAFDDEHVYIKYSIQGKIDGGTLDPPSISFYGIKLTNPDIEQSEGLMVGKLWINLPLAVTPEGQGFIKGLLGQIGELPAGVTQADIQRTMDTGMLVLDISKLLGGNIVEGLLFKAEAQGKVTNGNTFVGSIKRSALGDNPSNMARIIMLTAANNSLDSFMPIPYNCTHFQQIVFANQEYSVK